MVPELRKEFNSRFSEAKYLAQKNDLEHRCGCAIEFRIAETPLFLTREMAGRAGRLAEEILLRSVSSDLQQYGKEAIPSEFNVSGETSLPLFAAVDFAITGSRTHPEFKLIELQGFPSLYHYQPAFSESMRDMYGLPKELNGLIDPTLGSEKYHAILKRAILGSCDPQETVLLEIDPMHQKTQCDFLLAQKHLGIHIVDIEAVISQGNELFHPDPEGNLIRIKRIYNRAIADELLRKKIELRFDIRKDYDVEWAGHPNWYFRISKVLLPHLAGTNEAVPNAYYLSEADYRNLDLSRYVLKPLYSFAGHGVNVNPTVADIEAIPAKDRSAWLLQEKVNYADIITTPDDNAVRGELRVMLIWSEGETKPQALHTLVRLTRGKMVGVDYNKGLNWVGSSCALVQ
ncbi:MAG: hypothetical protein Q8916_12010 [Bacteroidota bacterium]|nr:hypothetical protein [Bacteroidota bacterium]MDP4231116.1 hypothetical protein [Bacteroidota bacterium]